MVEREIEESVVTLKSLLEVIKSKPEVQQSYSSQNIDTLYNQLSVFFKDLAKNELVSNISIYDTNLDIFVSLSDMHAPLSPHQETSSYVLSKVQKSEEPYHSIEIEQHGHLTLTVASPWYLDGQLAGYISLSEDLENILDEISHNTSSTILTLIPKHLSDKQVWQNLDIAQNSQATWDQFQDHVVIDLSSYSAVNHDRKIQLVPAALESTEDYITEIDGYNYITGHIPIVNSNEQYLGEIVFINNTTEFISESKRFSNSLLIAMVMLGLVFISLYTFFIQKIERQQTQLFKKLKKEVKDHRLTASNLIKAKEDAEQASKAKSIFLSSMSHEFRTPLNSIIGFTQLLSLNQEQLNKDDKEALSYIEKSGEHLLSLINDILDLSKIESGTLELHTSNVNISELFNTVTNMTQSFAEQHHVSLQIHDSVTSDLTISCDPQKVQQTILNFISNAIKYNFENGSVLLNAYKTTENKIRVLVTDTGQGIEAEAIDEIFQPFNRLDKANSTIEGTGIGLSICKQLTELMGGSIGAYKNSDKGMTFWVEFDPA